MYVMVKSLDPRAKLPTYAHGPIEDAGMDLHAIERTVLAPWQTVLLRTGLAIDLPSGIELQIRPKGGLAKDGLRVLNSPGTVDPGFRGEMVVIARWEPDLTIGADGYLKLPNPEMYKTIEEGDKIAQAVCMRYIAMDPHWSNWLSETKRGLGMLGSTGR